MTEDEDSVPGQPDTTPQQVSGLGGQRVIQPSREFIQEMRTQRTENDPASSMPSPSAENRVEVQNNASMAPLPPESTTSFGKMNAGSVEMPTDTIVSRKPRKTKLIIAGIIAVSLMVIIGASTALFIRRNASDAMVSNASNQNVRKTSSNVAAGPTLTAYYSVGDKALNEKAEVAPLRDGSKVVRTSFDYVHADGRKYSIETKQFPTDRKLACEKGVIILAGIGFECYFHFQSPGGTQVFYNAAIGNGDRGLYFVKSSTLLDVDVTRADTNTDEDDESVLGQIVDSFQIRKTP